MQQASAGSMFETLFSDEAVIRRVDRGTILHLAGAPGDRVHLLRSGLVLHVARDASGAETILGLSGPGEIIDPASAVDGADYQFDALTSTGCVVAGIDARRFRSALARDAALSLAVARALASRVRWISEAAHERSAQQVSGRVAARLLDLARMLGRANAGSIEMELPIDQSTFARLAGTSRESACKTLRRFKADGLVDYQGRRLRILRPDALGYMRCAGKER